MATGKERNVSESMVTAKEARNIAGDARTIAAEARREAAEALKQAVEARQLMSDKMLRPVKISVVQKPHSNKPRRNSRAAKPRTVATVRKQTVSHANKKMSRRKTNTARASDTRQANEEAKTHNVRQQKQKPSILARLLFTPKE